MKQLIILFFLILSFNKAIKGQEDYLNFKSNFSDVDSTLLKKEVKQSLDSNDVAISLTATCPWFETLSTKIIVRRNGQWEQKEIISEQFMENSIIKTTSITPNQQVCNEVLKSLIENNLFTMNIDSLIKKERQINKTVTEHFNVADGVDYEFVIITKNKQRIVFCPSPETFYEWMPETIERKYFINCRDSFLKLWKE